MAWKYQLKRDVDNLTKHQRFDLMLDLLELARMELQLLGEELTLETISTVTGVARERIGEIERAAIAKMRAAKYREKLLAKTP